MNTIGKITVSSLFAISVIAADAKSKDEEYASSAQVYDLSVSVKTTQAQRGKLKKGHPFNSSTDTLVYRKQGTQKWTGVIWGCECESIMGSWNLVGDTKQVAGVAIWNTKKPYEIELMDDMSWHVLNAIDKDGTKVECAWTIGESSDDSGAFLAFAGFGQLVVKYTASPCEDPELNCGSYVKMMSGNVAGWMPAPALTTDGKPGKCTFCGETEEGEEGETEVSEAWNYCPCMDLDTSDSTAVSGTWTLKFNASLSKSLMNSTSILEVYKKFPDNVKGAVALKIAEISAE